MISDNYTNGQPKPPGLCEWQIKHSVQDEDPMFGIASSHFALLAKLPGYIDDMVKEREEAAKQHHQQLAEERALHAAFECERRHFDEMLMRQERILSHLRQIESDFGVNVVDKLDYDRLAMPLQDRIEQICKRLPLDRLEQQAEHITHSGDKIELAAYKIDTIADAIASTKDTKRELYLLMTGGFLGAALLVYLVFILSTSAHVIVSSQQTTNAVAPSAMVEATTTQ
jgi:hypothetical protein